MKDRDLLDEYETEYYPDDTKAQVIARSEGAITDMVLDNRCGELDQWAKCWVCGDLEEYFDRIRTARRGEN